MLSGVTKLMVTWYSNNRKLKQRLDVIMHTCNLSALGKLRQEDQEFKANLRYRGTLALKEQRWQSEEVHGQPVSGLRTDRL